MGITVSQPSNKSMVDGLVERHHIVSAGVEGAFRAVDRALYFNLEEGASVDPYGDDPWRYNNLHLSAPCIYARSVEALDLLPGHSFLNLGSGTGYLNTIVGLMIGPHGINHGIEYHLDVVEYAHQKLERFKRESFAVDKYDFAEPVFVHGDCVKLNPNTRYDRIYFGAACVPELESFMKKLVKPAGGILVMPIENHLTRYIRISEVDWKIEKLMPVSFTPMIREPRNGGLSGFDDEDSNNKMIDMPLAQPKSLKNLCRIRIRQYFRDKTNQTRPNLMNSDNIEARQARKARAERKMIRYQRRKFKRMEEHVCPHNQQQAGDGVGSNCTRWPCREYNSFLARNSNGDRIMTRSARRRFELSRILNQYGANRSIVDNNNQLPSHHLRSRRDLQPDSASDSSSSDNRDGSTRTGRNYGESGSSITRGEGCSRTRPFVSRLSRQNSLREQAPSPARLGQPYQWIDGEIYTRRRGLLPRSSGYQANNNNSRPTGNSHTSYNWTSSPSNSDSPSVSSSARHGSRDSRQRGRQSLSYLYDLPAMLTLRSFNSIASTINSIYEPMPDVVDDTGEFGDSDYEEDSDEGGDSFDDDFNDPDLSGLESCEEDIITDVSEVGELEAIDDDDDGDDDNEEENDEDNYEDADDFEEEDADEDGSDDDDDEDGADKFNHYRNYLLGTGSTKSESTGSRAAKGSAARSSRLMSLRSRISRTVATRSASGQQSRDGLVDSSNEGCSSSSATTAVTSYNRSCNRQHQKHQRQHELSDRKRKRKRQSSSSSSSEAPTNPSPRQQQQQQRRQRNNKSECQRYHNHMSTYISQLPVPQVLKNYLNFDRDANM